MGAVFRHSPPAFRKESGRFVFGALALAAVLARPPALLAEEPRVPPSEQVPEIVVHGEGWKKDEPKQDPIGAATAISREDIEKEPLGVPALVDRTVGTRVREVGGFGSYSTVSIRGSTSNQVRVLLDGVPLDSGTSGGVNLGLFHAENLSRIEIYRGIAPLSLGGSAIGGVVDLRSRAPERTGLELGAGGGSFGLRRGGLHASRREEDEPWWASVGLLYEGAENDYEFTDDNNTPANPSDDFRAELKNADYNRGSAFVLAGRRAGGGDFSFLSTVIAREGGLNQGTTLASVNETRLLENHVTSSFRWEKPASDEGISFDARAFFNFSRFALDDPTGALSFSALATDDREYVGGVSAEAAWYPADPLKLGFYGEYRFDAFDPQSETGAGQVGPASTRHQGVLAAGAEWEPLPEEILFVLQGRIELARDRLENSNTGAPAGTDANRAAPTVRGGARWRPVKGFVLSANAASAVRLPAFVELFGNLGLIKGDPDLREEKGFNLDAGIEWERKDASWAKRFTAGPRYFFKDVEDLIVFEQNAAGVLNVVNLAAGEQTHGAEFELFWEFPGIFTWEGNFTWMRARQGTDPDFQVPFSAEWEAYSRLSADFAFQGAVEKAGAWVDYEYVSPNFTSESNLFRTAERSVWGAGAHAEFLDGKLEAVLEAKNLTDRKNLVNFANYPLPGFTVLGTLWWRAI